VYDRYQSYGALMPAFIALSVVSGILYTALMKPRRPAQDSSVDQA
jgi:hypothetical protein